LRLSHVMQPALERLLFLGSAICNLPTCGSRPCGWLSAVWIPRRTQTSEQRKQPGQKATGPDHPHPRLRPIRDDAQITPVMARVLAMTVVAACHALAHSPLQDL